MWSVELSREALKALRRMPRDQAIRIRRRLGEMEQDPWAAPGIKKLTDHPGFRLRVGEWRVLFLLREESRSIQVIRVAKRDEVYR